MITCYQNSSFLKTSHTETRPQNANWFLPQQGTGLKLVDIPTIPIPPQPSIFYSLVERGAAAPLTHIGPILHMLIGSRCVRRISIGYCPPPPDM
jgi:hypothetical protein